MEAITRLVADSLARHGFDRPVDPRRLQWSRWSRCDSPHSLLVVPSKPGIFALAEEVMDLSPSTNHRETNHGGTDAPGSLPRAESRGPASAPTADESTDREGHDFSRAVLPGKSSPALAAGDTVNGAHTADVARRMLAVLRFSEDDDMAFTLDRMFTQINPMRSRLASGRCFLRFVVIEDQAQRRTICAALNQWMISTAEKATDLSSDFQSSLEFTAERGGTDAPVRPVGATDHAGTDAFVRPADSIPKSAQAQQLLLKTDVIQSAPNLDSGAAKNLHCPHPLPSGF